MLFLSPDMVTGCKLCSTDVITMQYLLLTFREGMQTLFLRR